VEAELGRTVREAWGPSINSTVAFWRFQDNPRSRGDQASYFGLALGLKMPPVQLDSAWLRAAHNRHMQLSSATRPMLTPVICRRTAMAQQQKH